MNHFRAFDAVSNYSAFYEPVENVTERVPEYPLDRYREWLLATDETEVSFIPGISPGFDKSENDSAGVETLPIYERNQEAFESACEELLSYTDSTLNAMFVTSFNENHEYTQVEPCEPYGTAYLEPICDRLAEGEARRINLDRYATIGFEFDRTVSESDLSGESDPRFSRELAAFIRGMTIRNPEADHQVPLSLGGEIGEPYVPEGVFDFNPNAEARWFGGVTGQARICLDRATFTGATELVIEARGVPDGDHVGATVKVDGRKADQVRFEPGPFTEHVISLRPD